MKELCDEGVRNAISHSEELYNDSSGSVVNKTVSELVDKQNNFKLCLKAIPNDNMSEVKDEASKKSVTNSEEFQNVSIDETENIKIDNNKQNNFKLVNKKKCRELLKLQIYGAGPKLAIFNNVIDSGENMKRRLKTQDVSYSSQLNTWQKEEMNFDISDSIFDETQYFSKFETEQSKQINNGKFMKKGNFSIPKKRFIEVTGTEKLSGFKLFCSNLYKPNLNKIPETSFEVRLKLMRLKWRNMPEKKKKIYREKAKKTNLKIWKNSIFPNVISKSTCKEKSLTNESVEVILENSKVSLDLQNTPAHYSSNASEEGGGDTLSINKSQAIKHRPIKKNHKDSPKYNYFWKRKRVTTSYDSKIKLKKQIQLNTITCSLCSYQSSNASALRVHMRRHIGEKPFKCPMCKYSSVERSHLSRHMKQHTGRPMFCVLCDYRCIQLISLKLHMKKHNFTTMKCPFCMYTSSQSEDFCNHLRYNHKGAWYSYTKNCSECKFQCHETEFLIAHITQMHSENKSKTIDSNICETEHYTEQLIAHIEPESDLKTCSGVNSKIMLKTGKSNRPNCNAQKATEDKSKLVKSNTICKGSFYIKKLKTCIAKKKALANLKKYNSNNNNSISEAEEFIAHISQNHYETSQAFDTSLAKPNKRKVSEDCNFPAKKVRNSLEIGQPLEILYNHLKIKEEPQSCLDQPENHALQLEETSLPVDGTIFSDPGLMLRNETESNAFIKYLDPPVIYCDSMSSVPNDNATLIDVQKLDLLQKFKDFEADFLNELENDAKVGRIIYSTKRISELGFEFYLCLSELGKSIKEQNSKIMMFMKQIAILYTKFIENKTKDDFDTFAVNNIDEIRNVFLNHVAPNSFTPTVQSKNVEYLNVVQQMNIVFSNLSSRSRNQQYTTIRNDKSLNQYFRKKFEKRKSYTKLNNLIVKISEAKEYLSKSKYYMNTVKSFRSSRFFNSLISNTFIRLVLFNDCDPNILSGITVSEWESAKQKSQKLRTNLQSFTEAEQEIFKYFNVSLNIGRKCVLIPQPCADALDILSDPEMRERMNILPANIFIFPSNSENPICGQQCIDDFYRNNVPKSFISYNDRRDIGFLNIPEDICILIAESCPDTLEQPLLEYLPFSLKKVISGCHSPSIEKQNEEESIADFQKVICTSLSENHLRLFNTSEQNFLKEYDATTQQILIDGQGINTLANTSDSSLLPKLPKFKKAIFVDDQGIRNLANTSDASIFSELPKIKKQICIDDQGLNALPNTLELSSKLPKIKKEISIDNQEKNNLVNTSNSSIFLELPKINKQILIDDQGKTTLVNTSNSSIFSELPEIKKQIDSQGINTLANTLDLSIFSENDPTYIRFLKFENEISSLGKDDITYPYSSRIYEIAFQYYLSTVKTLGTVERYMKMLNILYLNFIDIAKDVLFEDMFTLKYVNETKRAIVSASQSLHGTNDKSFTAILKNAALHTSRLLQSETDSQEMKLRVDDFQRKFRIFFADSNELETCPMSPCTLSVGHLEKIKITLSESYLVPDSGKKITIDDYKKFVQMTFCRLVLFNDCDPATLSNVTFSQWILGKKKSYVSLTPQQLKKFSTKELRVFKFFNTTMYLQNPNLGYGQLLLIPRPCTTILNILADISLRRELQIPPHNLFIFPSLDCDGNENNPLNGPSYMNEFCQDMLGFDFDKCKLTDMERIELGLLNAPSSSHHFILKVAKSWKGSLLSRNLTNVLLNNYKKEMDSETNSKKKIFIFGTSDISRRKTHDMHLSSPISGPEKGYSQIGDIAIKTSENILREISQVKKENLEFNEILSKITNLCTKKVIISAKRIKEVAFEHFLCNNDASDLKSECDVISFINNLVLLYVKFKNNDKNIIFEDLFNIRHIKSIRVAVHRASVSLSSTNRLLCRSKRLFIHNNLKCAGLYLENLLRKEGSFCYTTFKVIEFNKKFPSYFYVPSKEIGQIVGCCSYSDQIGSPPWLNEDEVATHKSRSPENEELHFGNENSWQPTQDVQNCDFTSIPVTPMNIKKEIFMFN